MSYEFKMKGGGKGRRSRLHKKIMRASMNRMDVGHLPMWIEKWDGKLPVYGQVPTLFKNISN